MGLQVSRSRFILVPWLAHAVSRCRVSTVECKLFFCSYTGRNFMTPRVIPPVEGSSGNRPTIIFFAGSLTRAGTVQYRVLYRYCL